MVMNEELHSLFVADQAERNDHPEYDTPEYWRLRERDAARRRRLIEMIAEGALTAPDDYFHAALIFQHGETVEDIWQARELALRAAEMGATQSMDYKDSRWLAAAALDRWLMYQGKPQKYGTQFVPDGKRYRLWELDPATTDAELAESNVPPLEEQLKQAELLTQQNPDSGFNKDSAPWWLQEALLRWEHEES
jgi:hypothetical protein